ncbi:MAG TPA: isoleucine--tRNA ligase [Actinomycetota bacterium]|nr:isoleucine--tRNA ligase [Actinomycetota bacterium]
MPRYRPVDPKADFPKLEEAILRFWREARVFEKSLERRKGAPEWVFYDGPPTANNRPHIGHVEARTFKDLYPRYRTMTGYYVHRKAGWDCHGLPVEVEVEKAIGTRSKRDIEAFGVAEFVRLCRESVRTYVDDWRRVSERMGFWIDMDDAYWTMDPSYVQSVWWGLKRLHELGLLYRDVKVTAYCPRCGTPLSDAEVAMGYRQVRDPSVFVAFPLEEAADPDLLEGSALLVWTTTPWTLVSNLGVAVDPEATYVVARRGEARFVLAEARLQPALGPEAEVVASFPGKRLLEGRGTRYRPPFPNVDGDRTHRVVAAGFVSMEEGTGLVHMAPAFGAEDLEVGRREGWPVFNPVDEEGRFTELAPAFVRGRFVKDADPLIVEDLRARGLLVRAGEVEHTYPFCWRCETPLLYYARPSWYVRTTAYRDRLLEANREVNWYPEHIKEGRYGDWLKNNVDWALSRERYWGTPLPIWVCAQGHETVVGSLAELSRLAGRDLSGLDPHKPFIDEVRFPCPTCGEEAARVPEVVDAWFDSGAMPYAQWGYMGPGSPAEEVFRRRFPADFIAEGIDQTRGWFYSLMVEGVLLFGQNAYRNVVCHGLVLDAEGRKMSKRLGNVVEPEEAFDRFGADAVRWFMVASGSPWADRRLSFEAIGDVVRRFLLTLWNVYAFYVTYANLDLPDLAAAPPPALRPPLDRWALSQLHVTVALVREALDGFDATRAAKRLEQLVDDLSNWYVRRSRRRFWDPVRSGGGREDKLAAYATLHECLTTLARLLAPFVPFVAEELYRNLVAEVDPEAPESVHLTDFPVADPGLVDPALDEAMALARDVVSLGRQVRTEARVRVRQPLRRADVHVPGRQEALEPLLPLVADELNVKEVRFARSARELTGWRARPNFRALGPRLGPAVQDVARALGADDGSLASALAGGATVTVPTSSGEVELGPDDVELVQVPRAGWGVASDGRVTVALDLEPDEELRREGVVRELVHHVQALRRSAGLEVADRIVLGVEGGPAVAEALARHRDHLAGEVLAVEVVGGPVEAPAGEAEVSVDGEKVRLSLRPVRGAGVGAPPGPHGPLS